MAFVRSDWWDIDGTFDPRLESTTAKPSSPGVDPDCPRAVRRRSAPRWWPWTAVAWPRAATSAATGGSRTRRCCCSTRRARADWPTGSTASASPSRASSASRIAVGPRPSSRRPSSRRPAGNCAWPRNSDAVRAALVRERLHHLHAYRQHNAVDYRANAARSEAVGATASSTCPTVPVSSTRRSRTRKRPTRRSVRPATLPLPGRMSRASSARRLRVYELIWKRTVASQMTDATGETCRVRLCDTAAGRDAEFATSGTVITHQGFLLAYVEDSDERQRQRRDRERRAGARGRSGARRSQHRAERPRDLTAAALHRGVPRQEARGARGRSPVDVRVDHGHDRSPRVRVEEGQRAVPSFERSRW